MGIGKEIYSKLSIGTEGTAVAATGVTVGASSSVYEPFERFNDVVNELEQMESAGLVAITVKHHEQTTGRRYIDLVRFRKLR